MRLKPVVLLAMLVVLAIVGTLLALKKAEGTNNHPGKVGGDFTLTSANGPVSLSDFEGKAKLVFFGYTHCPDVCPLTLANVKVGLKQLPEALRNQVQTIFVSVDPKRDTFDHLSEYVSFFDPSFVGLTGTKEEVDRVVRQYGAFYRIEEGDGKNYTVSHSARLYVIGKDNQIKQYLYHDSSSEEIAEAIKKLLAAN
ncbi:SCO family protein [Marinomonas fungiae]|uniref:Cytochrome oxidase Cu insertion factor, SCO1/SenC/PrrC family n=1 Tax=Marinomonas fungiae TaxID=1137284 RepID=A0A0K6IHZ7_9GAMM|nr:SCO family protein [Marinomonas fungiae]CUB02713.1 Cytochrome oxidase Cu insertion factor, SCO1/SenC/PrrC family [Marinomonas fungiae]